MKVKEGEVPFVPPDAFLFVERSLNRDLRLQQVPSKCMFDRW